MRWPMCWGMGGLGGIDDVVLIITVSFQPMLDVVPPLLPPGMSRWLLGKTT